MSHVKYISNAAEQRMLDFVETMEHVCVITDLSDWKMVAFKVKGISSRNIR